MIRSSLRTLLNFNVINIARVDKCVWFAQISFGLIHVGSLPLSTDYILSIANDFWHFEIIKTLGKLSCSKWIFSSKHSCQRDLDAKVIRALDSGWYESNVKCLKSVNNRIAYSSEYAIVYKHFIFYAHIWHYSH